MRLDLYLSDKGFCQSRSKAQVLINEKRVTVNGKITEKASFEVSDGDNVAVLPGDKTEFVGRGGNKLEHALVQFSVSSKDKVCLDIGASTGGFTECLLMGGAKCVYAVDSGKGQLAKSLLCDSRVISIEGFNARNLTTEVLDGLFMDLIVMDVSFISQKLLYPAILRVAKSGCEVITLIKPQFEAGRQYIGKKGIIKDEKVRKRVVEDIISYAKECGFEVLGVTQSPILGGDGNTEFLLHLRVK